MILISLALIIVLARIVPASQPWRHKAEANGRERQGGMIDDANYEMLVSISARYLTKTVDLKVSIK